MAEHHKPHHEEHHTVHHAHHEEASSMAKMEKDFEKRVDAYDYVLMALSFTLLGSVIGFYFFKGLCTFALPAFVLAVLLAARPVYNYVK
jgi:hypothetical protein